MSQGQLSEIEISNHHTITPSQLVPTNRCASAVARCIVPFTRCFYPTQIDTFSRSLCSPTSNSASPTFTDGVRPHRIPSPTPDLSALQSPLLQSDNERSIHRIRQNSKPNFHLPSLTDTSQRLESDSSKRWRTNNTTSTAPSQSSKPRPDWDARAGR